MKHWLLAVVLGSWLSVSMGRAAHGQTVRAGADWRREGAIAGFDLNDKRVTALAIRTLAEVGETSKFDEMIDRARPLLQKQESLRGALAFALGRLLHNPAKSMSVLLQIAQFGELLEQPACDALARWQDSGLEPSRLLASRLAPGPSDDAARWYFCIGIWTEQNLDAVLAAQPAFFGLPRMAERISPSLVPRAAQRLIAMLAERPQDALLLQGAVALARTREAFVKALEQARQGPGSEARLRAAAALVISKLPTPPPSEERAARIAREREKIRNASDLSQQLGSLAELVNLGATSEVIPDLANLYRRAFRNAAIVSRALAAAQVDPETAAKLRPQMLFYLRVRAGLREPEEIDDAIGAALLSVGPITRSEALGLLDYSYGKKRSAGLPELERSDMSELRFWAVVLSGGDELVVSAARWLTDFPLRSHGELQQPQVARGVIRELEPLLASSRAAAAPGSSWQGAMAAEIADASSVRADARELLRRILDDTRWTTADEPFLRSLLTLLPPGPELDELRAAVERRLSLLRPPEQPLLPRLWKWAAALFGAHFLIWLGLLLTVYPRSRMVQAAMLFNPLGRAVTGWGYTQLLVLASPRLRERLFHPLVDASSDTEVASFDAASFSELIKVAPILPRKNPQAPAEELPPVSWTKLAEGGGLVVIEGASGLGKTHVLKALLERARAEGRTCLFVRASECNGGVLKEIEERLALDHSSGFVHSMIHRGAIELFLDGLNEAQPSGVAEIAQFCERAVNARITITTQPMSWPCPRRARRFRLLPLEPDELEEFLLSQWPAVGSGGEAEQAQYAARVREFLAERTSARDLAVLQNRIDLAFVAHLLARRETPNIHSLRKQVVDDAARAYELASPGGAFPLAGLGAAAMRVLEKGHPVLVIEGLDAAVLAHLAERKILLRRGVADWLFRHDTITCYFAAQGVLAPLITALAIDPQVISEERLTNPRFTGVYLQLAESLPLAAAQALAAALREHGRASGDRTLEIAYQDVLDRRDD